MRRGQLGAMEQMCELFHTCPPRESFDSQLQGWKLDVRQDNLQQLQQLEMIYAASSHHFEFGNIYSTGNDCKY
jgi:hypothetical protein